MCSLACRAVSMELLSMSVSPLTTSASSPVYNDSECTRCVSQGIACYTASSPVYNNSECTQSVSQGIACYTASSPVYKNSECTQWVSQGIACYTLGRETMFLSNTNIYTVNYKHSDYTPGGMVGYHLATSRI